jgi:ribosome-binding factor A
MNIDRNHKIEEQLREIAARFIERESNKTALLTVTRVELYDRGHSAMIYLSVMPESGEDSAINFLKRKRAELRETIKRQLNMRTIPFLDVQIDTGQKALHTIEALLKEGGE